MFIKRVSILFLAVGLFCLAVPLLFGVVNLVEAQTETPRPTPTTDPMITPTATETADPDPTHTPTAIPDPTDTPRPTATSAPIDTPTATNTPGLPATNTPIPTAPGVTPGAPTATATAPSDDSAAPPPSQDVHGSIQGMVYQDVTGNGRCINTGVEGEGPVAGIPIEFVSSDEQTIITLTSGSDGSFGLVGAGASYWRVSARPGADWVVTSEQTLSAPIDADSLVVTDINFCVRRASDAGVVLPASGAPQTVAFGWLALVGLLFIGLGLVRFWQERRLA
jgi:hypothetical protein